MSLTNGHPSRKFRNVKLIKKTREYETFIFEGCEINIPKDQACFKKLLDAVTESAAECRADGFTEEDMCAAMITMTRGYKEKIDLLEGCAKTPEFEKEMLQAQKGFIHGVVSCAYLGACVWGENFGIYLADGTWALVPEDEIGALCRIINDYVKK